MSEGTATASSKPAGDEPFVLSPAAKVALHHWLVRVALGVLLVLSGSGYVIYKVVEITAHEALEEIRKENAEIRKKTEEYLSAFRADAERERQAYAERVQQVRESSLEAKSWFDKAAADASAQAQILTDRTRQALDDAHQLTVRSKELDAELDSLENLSKALKNIDGKVEAIAAALTRDPKFAEGIGELVAKRTMDRLKSHEDSLTGFRSEIEQHDQKSKSESDKLKSQIRSASDLAMAAHTRLDGIRLTLTSSDSEATILGAAKPRSNNKSRVKIYFEDDSGALADETGRSPGEDGCVPGPQFVTGVLTEKRDSDSLIVQFRRLLLTVPRAPTR